jgi:hypothetical protein
MQNPPAAKTKTRRPPLKKGEYKDGSYFISPFSKGGRRAFSLYGGGILIFFKGLSFSTQKIVVYRDRSYLKIWVFVEALSRKKSRGVFGGRAV